MTVTVELGLSGLTRALSKGSYSLLSGFGFSFCSAILLALILTGNVGDEITLPGFPYLPPLPPVWVAIVLAFVSVAFGWAGWTYLLQARRSMHRLEFELCIDPNEIRSALTACSFVSTSVTLVKALCIGTILFLSFVFKPLLVEPLLASELSRLKTFIIVILLLAPYILVGISSQIRYFNPDNWVSRPWVIRLKNWIVRQNLEQIRELLLAQLPVVKDPRARPILTILMQLPDRYLAEVDPATHQIMRKYGELYGLFRIIWSKDTQREIWEICNSNVMKKINEDLDLTEEERLLFDAFFAALVQWETHLIDSSLQAILKHLDAIEEEHS